MRLTEKPVFTDLAEAVCVAIYMRDLMAQDYAVYSAYPPIITVSPYDPSDYREPIYLAVANVEYLPYWDN